MDLKYASFIVWYPWEKDNVGQVDRTRNKNYYTHQQFSHEKIAGENNDFCSYFFMVDRLTPWKNEALS